ncbi:TrkA-N domain protein [Magnetococcus marinus MC-1]|uniref:BK channel n=1 Tax=Magnetococcus marinus (strain ATCC BAA-1437 / JCM 17883 / MC-1) TaxID=156889 RepID=A0LDX2_MAGMM|nr:potassium channel protein [Magnetococcus marinus]ABK46165.1 TrkA-N domain protein [Magnetococcus marinus MC-1]
MVLSRRQRGPIKTLFFHLLEDPSSRARNAFSLLMMLVVFASLIAMTLETDPDLTLEEQLFFDFLDHAFNIIFLMEYMLRWWVCSDFLVDFEESFQRQRRMSHRRKHHQALFKALRAAFRPKLLWMRKPLSIIDLLAILPIFRAFRLLRILRVLRILKLFRYSKRLTFFSSVIAERSFELTSLFTLAAVVLGMVTLAFFMAERGHNPDITNLWDALYWTMITITTVGYGDISPATDGGRMVAITGTIVGIWVTVLMTSIIVSALTERIFELKEQRMERQIEKLRDHFIICGLNLIGQAICQTLQAENRPFCVIDREQALVDEAMRKGWNAMRGDVSDETTWIRAGLIRAHSVISAIHDEATNVYLILNIRETRPSKDCYIIVAASTETSIKRLMKVGANRAISPLFDGGQYMAYTAMRPTALRFFDLALHRAHTDLEIEELMVPANSSFANVSLRDSQIGNTYNVIVLGHLRNGEMHFNPNGHYVIQGGDLLVCTGHLDDLERLKQAIDE